jgi:dihydrolipoamide dehydrogenase
MNEKYKAVVIGSGPAGYTAAIRIAQLGGKVALIERDLIGGICTNWGCTPSKAMITSAKYAKMVKEASNYGIELGETKIDFRKVAMRRDKIMQNTRKEIRHLLDHWNVDIIQGTGEIVDPNHVKVSIYENPNLDLKKADGTSPYDEGYEVVKGDMILETENILIATGSEPLVPPFLQKADSSIVNSNKLIWIKDLPEELTIIGGGIIGLEFSALFSHFGTKVRIVEFMDRCLATMDPEISAEIEKHLKELGVEILCGHKVLDISNGVIKAEKIATGETVEIQSPMNLIAIGRKAVINNPEYDKIGLEYTPKGIIVNEYMQTNFPNIFAIGDATGQSILAHVAIQQGILAAEYITGQTTEDGSFRKMDYSVVPAVVYTLPEVATVGTIPADLSDIEVVKFPFSANLRANIEEHNTGFVKMWFTKDNTTGKVQKLLACQMIGDNAGEIIQGYANIIGMGCDLEKLSRIIHAHPTYNEIVRNSLEFALGRAIEHI